MHEAFWNGLSGVRWEEAPLGPEAIWLVRRLRERGYAGRTCRDYGHAVVHFGRYLHEELGSDRVRDERVVAGVSSPVICRGVAVTAARWAGGKNRPAGAWRTCS
jgi:hypothetical protein